jgi:hypothetical protein
MNSYGIGLGSKLRRGWFVVSLGLASLALGCKGDTGSAGPQGPPGPPAGSGATATILDPSQDAPGVVIAITGVSGATGSGNTFRAGDTLTVTFTVRKNDGSAWNLGEMGVGAILASGPTSNYTRVLKEKVDVVSHATENADGSFSYKFADPIPADYEAPINDSGTYGAADGNLSGTPLQTGTYTVGMYLGWFYTVNGKSFSDVGNATSDFLYGTGAVLDTREVVTQANCNACHTTMRAHGGFLRDVKMCGLCHTVGAEDFSGPPGAHLWFPVVLHKVHNGEHLPSVNGVATNANGSRNYGATPAPYTITNVLGQVSDFSHVAFPVWPNLNVPMPRDAGYSSLTAPQQATEDLIREGVTDCAKCHGDPDGSGPLPPPAQGDLCKTHPTRLACGSCHDDVDWQKPYTSNTQTMPVQNDDAACALCHDSSGAALAIDDAHRHPLNDPVVNPGLNFPIVSVVEAGTNDGNGAIDPGEKIAVSFRIRDDSGAAVTPDPAQFSSVSAVISGPTSNYNLVLNTSIPTAAIASQTGPTFTLNVPEKITLEFIAAAADDTQIEAFVTSRTPHWNVTGGLTTVWERTATAGGDTTLAAAASAVQNFVDVASATGFARGDALVIDDGIGGLVEYLVIQFVDGTRLWFTSPTSQTMSGANPDLVYGLRFPHAAGATVKEVTLTKKTLNTDYTLTAATGTITEVGPNSFKAGDAVLATYTTDFVMPAVYPGAINESPDLDVAWGKWRSLPIVDGTYTIGMWASINRVVSLWGETNTYRGTSPPSDADFLVGSATTLEHYSLITSASTCNACHNDIYFHGGGRRGFDTCVLCHGTAGSEDRPRYVAANAPATTQVSINFRELLHKVHMGENLDHASTYTVVGFGSTAYPNNFGLTSFGEVAFPTMPDGVKQCTTCHGTHNTAWIEPTKRMHPAGQAKPTRAWRAVCGACHDSDAAQSHIDSQTSPSGGEACAVCHDPGGLAEVELAHKVR